MVTTSQGPSCPLQRNFLAIYIHFESLWLSRHGNKAHSSRSLIYYGTFWPFRMACCDTACLWDILSRRYFSCCLISLWLHSSRKLIFFMTYLDFFPACKMHGCHKVTNIWFFGTQPSLEPFWKSRGDGKIKKYLSFIILFLLITSKYP